MLIGASGGVTAVILLFVFHFPQRTILLMFVLPVPAWVLGVLLIVFNVLGMHQMMQGGVAVAYDVSPRGRCLRRGVLPFSLEYRPAAAERQRRLVQENDQAEAQTEDPTTRTRKSTTRI